MRLDTEWTWAKVEAAAAATAGGRRTRRGEWRGPWCALRSDPVAAGRSGPNEESGPESRGDLSYN